MLQQFAGLSMGLIMFMSFIFQYLMGDYKYKMLFPSIANLVWLFIFTVFACYIDKAERRFKEEYAPRKFVQFIIFFNPIFCSWLCTSVASLAVILVGYVKSFELSTKTDFASWQLGSDTGTLALVLLSLFTTAVFYLTILYVKRNSI